MVYTHSAEQATEIDSDGEMRGLPHAGRRAFLVELVRQLMLGIGQAPKIQPIPLERGIRTLRNQQRSALFNLSRTPQREPHFKWVGPLLSNTVAFYQNVTSPTGIRRLEDARHVDAICIYRGNAHAQYLRANGFDNLIAADSYESCWEMLKLKRVSLTTLGDDLEPQMRLQTQTGADSIANTKVPLYATDGYLAFSTDTSDSLIALWQTKLDQIKATGRYDQLLVRYYQLATPTGSRLE
ncbi:substrate-binding periplasmic protein [Motiliproteus sp.]|uniref:substrate-binding periplasmic protein n=1 Tax=Motiliproteus sp. TaxID=1898955 RepID=UPI003BAB882F